MRGIRIWCYDESTVEIKLFRFVLPILKLNKSGQFQIIIGLLIERIYYKLKDCQRQTY